MKTIGLIAEYNPFHNGHEYQLNIIKKMYPESRIIIVMSGDFVQRGEPAIIDKWTRSDMALTGGADMIIELPVRYATASSRDFAYGAVSILDSLGVVDELAFGCEDDDCELFMKVADFLSNPPSKYEDTLFKNINNGMSYPKARESALIQYFPEVVDIIAKPNNILALEYIIVLKKIQSTIIPLPILRNGNGYNDNSINDESMCSAMAIRNSITTFPKAVESQMPDYAYKRLIDNEYRNIDSFSRELRYKLLSETDFTKYYDISEDLSNKINKYKKEFSTTSAFIDMLKSKNITYSHIARCLVHILLNIENNTMNDKIPKYARILGLKKGDNLFGDIKELSSIPLISKLADADTILSEEALEQLKTDIFASEIYSGINEYTRRIIIHS